MPPTTHRIAQTSTEAKRQYKKNGPGIPERQQRQLARAYELDQRATRLREAEKRRAVAKKRREEREEQQRLLRQQQGIGAATQAIGYNHTQARTKNWMESFLGVDKKKAEAKRQRELELDKKLDAITESIDKEPWDDDEADDDLPLEIPTSKLNPSAGEKWTDDELDDNSLLEAHDQVLPDPDIEQPANSRPASVGPAIPVTHFIAPRILSKPEADDDAAFVREHGITNRIVEDVLDRVSEPLIELLSQDVSLRLPTWEPPSSLLHKLNPSGLPPHRLRIKVGCVVTVLRDINTSSQLSKSQHLQILRVENDRIECLVRDGQLQGTKTFLTRVPFLAKYKNLDQYPFQRTQFPIRVATDHLLPPIARDRLQNAFKLPSVPGRPQSTSLMRRSVLPTSKPSSRVKQNPTFKLPGLPASKSAPTGSVKAEPKEEHLPNVSGALLDGWDEFLESGTQIARELSIEPTKQAAISHNKAAITPPRVPICLPPLSTQDLNFSLDDLEENSPVATSVSENSLKMGVTIPTGLTSIQSIQSKVDAPFSKTKGFASKDDLNDHEPTFISYRNNGLTRKPTSKVQAPVARAQPIDLSVLRPSQKPPSVSDRPGLKRKAYTAPSVNYHPSSKKHCDVTQASALPPKAAEHEFSSTLTTLSDFFTSTQEVASFFDDDDSLFGSPPIPV